MPVTPFHLGTGLAAKSLAPRRFSLTVFTLVQVVMDCEVIARLAELKSFGLPILIGLSRKRFINAISPSKPDERLGGSLAGSLAAVRAGADVVRVHDVAETVQALRIMVAIEKAR